MGCYIFVVIMAIAAASGYAQQPGVNLKETLQWMHDFAADNATQFVGQSSVDNQSCELGQNQPNCRQRHDRSRFESQGCSATVTWLIDLNTRDSGKYTYRLSLKDLDPGSVVPVKDPPFEVAVHVDTTNNVKKIVEAFTPPEGKTWDKHFDEPQSWVELVFDSADHAKRFVNAFKHAIQLCGGRPSAF